MTVGQEFARQAVFEDSLAAQQVLIDLSDARPAEVIHTALALVVPDAVIAKHGLGKGMARPPVNTL